MSRQAKASSSPAVKVFSLLSPSPREAPGDPSVRSSQLRAQEPREHKVNKEKIKNKRVLFCLGASSGSKAYPGPRLGSQAFLQEIKTTPNTKLHGEPKHMKKVFLFSLTQLAKDNKNLIMV